MRLRYRNLGVGSVYSMQLRQALEPRGQLSAMFLDNVAQAAGIEIASFGGVIELPPGSVPDNACVDDERELVRTQGIS
jgi:hypothetical protein